MVQVFLRQIHMDSQVYPDATKFDPDRWIVSAQTSHSRPARFCLHTSPLLLTYMHQEELISSGARAQAVQFQVRNLLKY